MCFEFKRKTNIGATFLQISIYEVVKEYFINLNKHKLFISQSFSHVNCSWWIFIYPSYQGVPYSVGICSVKELFISLRTGCAFSALA